MSRDRDHRPERSRLPDGEVGQDFGVELNVAPGQGIEHVPSVVVVLSCSSVDSWIKLSKIRSVTMVSVLTSYPAALGSILGVLNLFSEGFLEISRGCRDQTLDI